MENTKNTELVHLVPDEVKKYTSESKEEKDKTPAWLSAELRVDEFHVKEQSFVITGWVNGMWVVIT